MTELDPQASRVLEAAKGADDPTDEDKMWVRGALVRRLGATAFGASVATAASHAIGAGASGVGAAGLAKGSLLSSGLVGLALGLTVGGAGVGVVVSARTPGAPELAVNAPSSAMGGPRGRPRSEAHSLPRSSASLPAETIVPSPATRQAGRPAVSTRDAAGPDLASESRALAEVQRALRDGQADRALTLLDEQDHTLRGGALSAERAAARVFALCQAGRRPEARAAAAEFLRRWPRSPLARRVRGGCDP